MSPHDFRYRSEKIPPKEQPMENNIDTVEIVRMLTDCLDTMLTMKKDVDLMKNHVVHLTGEIKVLKGELKAVKKESLHMKLESNEDRQKELLKKDVSERDKRWKRWKRWKR